MQKKSALDDFGLPKKTFKSRKMPYARGAEDSLGLDKEPDFDDKTDGKPKPPPQSSGFVMDDMIAEMIYIPAETADYAGQTFFVVKDSTGQTPYAEKAGRFVPLWPSNTITQYIKWPSEATDYVSDMVLFERIMKFIEKWVDVDDSSRKLASLYVMFTWVYDAFDGVPYLRILADLGSGKSRFGIDVLGSIVYKPIRTMAATSMAALFRTIDNIKGTLILDEADLGDDSDKTSELVQVLNSGYKRGIPVLRCENAGRNDAMRAFQVFGPKIIISREHMKDHALESRCLPIRMRETTRKDLPYIVDRSLEKEAQILRNMLLQWRLDRLPGAADRVDYSFAELPIAGRLKELLLLLSAAIVDEELKAMLRTYAINVNAENSDRRGESLEGETVEIIQSIFMDQMKRNYLDEQKISTIDIAILLNNARDERKQLPQRYVTSEILRERLAQKITKGTGNKSYLSITIVGVKALCARFGVVDEFSAYADTIKKPEVVTGVITKEAAAEDAEIRDALAGLIF
jgi:hypothetical protein